MTSISPSSSWLRLVGRAFQCLQLDIWLGSVQNLAPTSDVLHQMFVQRVGDPQPVDECESRDILTTLVYFCQLTLKLANVRLNWGKPRGGEEFHYNSHVTEITGMCCLKTGAGSRKQKSSKETPLSLEGKVYLYSIELLVRARSS